MNSSNVEDKDVTIRDAYEISKNILHNNNQTKQSVKILSGGSTNNKKMSLSSKSTRLNGKSNKSYSNNITFNLSNESIPSDIFSIDQLHFILATVINDEIELNTSSSDQEVLVVPNSSCPQSMFYSVHEVDMSNADFVFRISEYSGFEESTYIYSLIYLFRIKKDFPDLALNPLNFHRLYLTSLVVSAKVVQDEIHPQSHYGRVGGINEVKELNRLEMIFLKFLKHNLHVSLSDYSAMVDHMKSLLQRRARPLLEVESK